jgi:hypothetical protein
MEPKKIQEQFWDAFWARWIFTFLLAVKVPSPVKGENTHKPVDFISPFCYRSAFGSLFLLRRRRFCCKGEPLLWWSWSAVNEGYSMVADLAARRCDGQEGVALLGPEQRVSSLCSGCYWRLWSGLDTLARWQWRRSPAAVWLGGGRRWWSSFAAVVHGSCCCLLGWLRCGEDGWK